MDLILDLRYSLQAEEEGKNKGYVVTMANREHSSGISLHLLARIIEYGTSKFYIKWFGDPRYLFEIKLPPRKHWRPALDRIVEVQKEVGTTARANMLREKLAALR